jgi:hypothetical protein
VCVVQDLRCAWAGLRLPTRTVLRNDPFVSDSQKARGFAPLLERDLLDGFVPRHDKAKNSMRARVRARRTHGSRSACFAVALAILSPRKSTARPGCTGNSRAACNLLNLREKIWRREWDSNSPDSFRFCNLQIPQCQGCRKCQGCRRTLHRIAPCAWRARRKLGSAEQVAPRSNGRRAIVLPSACAAAARKSGAFTRPWGSL